MKSIVQLPIKRKDTHQLTQIRRSKLRITTSCGTHIIDRSEILFLKSDSNYCEIFLADGNKILCSKTLKYFVQKLNDNSFYRTHNSYLVNLQYVTFIDATYKFLKVVQHNNIPIARSRIVSFKIKLNQIFN